MPTLNSARALPLMVFIAAPLQAGPPTVPIGEDITQDTLWSNRHRYVITNEVHVRPGVHLTVEDGTRILIRNGSVATTTDGATTRAGLVFDSGSRLSADTLHLHACDDQDRPVQIADNRGVFFLGSSSIAEKDGIATEFATQASRFEARAIHAAYLVLDRKPRFFPRRHPVLNGGWGRAYSIGPHSMRIRGMKPPE